MPTYVYACDSCGAQFEQFQSFKDEPLRSCPKCANAVRRVFQPVGIVFKGSGWYITDSRGGNNATTNPEGAKASPEAKSDKAETSEKATTSDSAPKADSAAKPADSAPKASAAAQA